MTHPTTTASHKFDSNSVVVTANIQSSSLLTTVELFYVQRHDEFDDLDFRDAIWRVTLMEPRREGQYVGTAVPLGRNTAVFARLSDIEGIIEGSFTTPVQIFSF